MVAVVTVAESQLEQEGVALVRSAESLVVRDDASYAEAGERRKLVKAYLERVGEVMDPIVDAAHKAHKVAVAQRATLQKPAQDADAIYKARRLAYEDEQATRRKAIEEAARKERERLEANAQARAAAEQKRLQAEEEDRRLAQAAAAEAAGDKAAAEKILAEPIAAPVVAPIPVFVPPLTVAAPPKVDGIAARIEWDFEIVDPALIPREYLVIDDKKIRGVVRALKEQAKIPGVRVFSRRNEAVRSR